MDDPIDIRYKQLISNIGDRIRFKNYPLIRACIAEACGTAILVIFGCGVLAQVFLGDHGAKAHGSFISVSLGWGFAVYLGVFFAGQNGHGLINPAITLAFAIIGKLPWKRVPLYTISQVIGGFIGGLAVYGVYYEKIMQYVATKDSNVFEMLTTGNIFVTNPWGSTLTCFLDQVFGTALLASGALVMCDSNGWNLPNYLHPLHLGILVYMCVGAFALNAGCALNPARDLGPRLMLTICGK